MRYLFLFILLGAILDDDLIEHQKCKNDNGTIVCEGHLYGPVDTIQ